MGSIYKRGRIYWISYYRGGKQYFESARTERKGEARRLLAMRTGDIARGVAPTPRHRSAHVHGTPAERQG